MDPAGGARAPQPTDHLTAADLIGRWVDVRAIVVREIHDPELPDTFLVKYYSPCSGSWTYLATHVSQLSLLKI